MKHSNAIILTLAVFMATSAFAGQQAGQQTETSDDLIYGHHPVVASPGEQGSQGDTSLYNNTNQEDDLIYGYRPSVASHGEPSVSGGTMDNETDLIYGSK
jgi:hypothetical protein